MRYQALEIYSAVLRALGVVFIIGGLVSGGFFIVAGMAQHDPLPQALAVSGACFSILGGLLAGLGALASGQLLCVWIDIEANTRIAARQEWQLDR